MTVLIVRRRQSKILYGVFTVSFLYNKYNTGVQFSSKKFLSAIMLGLNSFFAMIFSIVALFIVESSQKKINQRSFEIGFFKILIAVSSYFLFISI
jgi:hypothetical protein